MLRRPRPGPAHTGVCAHVACTPTFQQQPELLQQRLGWGDGARGPLGAGRPWGPWQAELKGNLAVRTSEWAGWELWPPPCKLLPLRQARGAPTLTPDL